MRCFLLFGGDDFYAQGGADDLQGAFHSLADAKAAFGTMFTGHYVWGHVYDLANESIIWNSKE